MAKSETPQVSDAALDKAAKEVASALGSEKVKIKLPKYQGAPDPVEVGVNGYFFIIKRGEEVEVPPAVKEILENAEML